MEPENKPLAKQLTTILLATRNRHKTREIQTMLGESVVVSDATDHEGLPEIEETGISFKENAKLKAEGISRCLRGLVLADDSGLEVDALGKEPGVYSARYAVDVFSGIGSIDEANTALVLERMKDVQHESRTARFRCVLAVAQGGITLATFAGAVEGMLATEVRGEGGFGYDPIFIPLGYDQTFGELPSEIKHSMSHRSRALDQFQKWWAQLRTHGQ